MRQKKSPLFLSRCFIALFVSAVNIKTHFRVSEKKRLSTGHDLGAAHPEAKNYAAVVTRS
jgi:hypothetical protein